MSNSTDFDPKELVKCLKKVSLGTESYQMTLLNRAFDFGKNDGLESNNWRKLLELSYHSLYIEFNGLQVIYTNDFTLAKNHYFLADTMLKAFDFGIANKGYLNGKFCGIKAYNTRKGIVDGNKMTIAFDNVLIALTSSICIPQTK
jgi:hypothetical protein